ncbi:hypothetical protein JHE00_26460 [Prauserella sp. ASG 168]|uniref:DUF308 domain-containing protein n=1 Tax=Prauserella cavernicola TaxID=2800127 RepID=A0A934V8L3_9PSEU|nr:hypothetical protein [Prauserella cavernicola]MBK1787888.1 hypothetical protein [Prauserella cavernicola]
MWLGLPLAGGGLLLLLKHAVGWLLNLPWVPFQGPLELFDSIADPLATSAAVAIGVVGGLVLAFFATRAGTAVTVSEQQVVLTRGERTQEVAGDAVSGVFRDGGELVVLGHDGAERARDECDLPASKVAAAFTEHGYRWLDGDPHEDEYRRWVPETPGLPTGADALLKARERALSKGDSGKADIRDLREELGRLGVVVRDRKKRQYWRLTQN